MRMLQLAIASLRVQCGLAKGPQTIYEKLDDVEYGDTVAVHWGGEFKGVIDHGYVTSLPGFGEEDANLGGLVHIPYPQNPGGKGNPEAEWVTLQDLSLNPMVERVERVRQWRENGVYKAFMLRAKNLAALIRVNRMVPGSPLYSINASPDAQKTLQDFERACYAMFGDQEAEG